MSQTTISIGKNGYVSRHNGIIVDYKEQSLSTIEAVLTALEQAVKRVQQYCEGEELRIETEYPIIEDKLTNYGLQTKAYRELTYAVQGAIEYCDADVIIRTKKPATATRTLRDIDNIKGTAKLGTAVVESEEFETADSLLDAFGDLPEEEDM